MTYFLLLRSLNFAFLHWQGGWKSSLSLPNTEIILYIIYNLRENRIFDQPSSVSSYVYCSRDPPCPLKQIKKSFVLNRKIPKLSSAPSDGRRMSWWRFNWQLLSILLIRMTYDRTNIWLYLLGLLKTFLEFPLFTYKSWTLCLLGSLTCCFLRISIEFLTTIPHWTNFQCN